jgi:NACalpha-BTF3-like transcription factor
MKTNFTPALRDQSTVPMECSICMEAIAPETNISTTECGHTYHFRCLNTWIRTQTTCPLCRASFEEPEQPQPAHGEFILATGPPNPTPFRQMIEMLRVGAEANGIIMDHRWNGMAHLPLIPDPEIARRETVARIYRAVRQVNMDRPFEEFTGETDQRDIRLVMEQADVDQGTATAYMRYNHGDIVNTILSLGGEIMPIPEFNARSDRAPAVSDYVSPIVATRIAHRVHDTYDRGYESS